MAIEQRPFGRTGHMSSAVIFGAAALKDVDQTTADRVLGLLLDHGVNHIDTAPRYGDAELRIGPWMERHRDGFFLATKTDRRDHEGAKAQIHRSLERLRTDRIDLIQLHAWSIQTNGIRRSRRGVHWMRRSRRAPRAWSGSSA